MATATHPAPHPATTLNHERSRFNDWFNEEFDKRMEARRHAHTPKLAIVATQGNLDSAYPPFILASTAAALGWECSIFFTFYGLELLRKELRLGISPLGNPAMPMKMPFGPQWFQGIDWKIPNALKSNIPGFEAMAAAMMHKTLANKGVASVADLRELCLEADVRFSACQMTVDLFGHRRETFIDEIHQWVGATSFLPEAAEADVTLFM